MSEKMVDKFIAAIRSRRKINITFFSKEDSGSITRKCAPMDYGPSRRSKDQSDRFHLWDYEGKRGPHVLSIRTTTVTALEVTEELFDPAEFVTWPPNWLIERDWGQYS